MVSVSGIVKMFVARYTRKNDGGVANPYAEGGERLENMKDIHEKKIIEIIYRNADVIPENIKTRTTRTKSVPPWS